jgi:hypothetical protein
MKNHMTYLYLRGRNAVRAVFDGKASEAGMGKLAVTVILLASAVALTLLVIGLVNPAILGLVEDTVEDINNFQP